MSDFMTSHLFYSPWYKTQCILLNAQAADVPQGTIICAKGAAGSASASATFSGTEANLTGEAQTYTPEGSVDVTISESGGASADGTFDVIGAANYGAVYGILLKDVEKSASAQSVDVIVCGELFRETINAVYKAANSDNDIPEPVVAALRNIGIVLK
jgi:hypothetical protein